ncbi:MAG: thioredoxin family protein [Cyanobacteriota bacterium]|nr:thioredoxin family protein [Cyanobacteriota bacterium]
MLTQTDLFNHPFLHPTPFVLVDFSAPWCGLCRYVQPITSRMAEEWGGSLSVVRVNADQDFLLAHHYRIRTLPTLLLLRDGVEIERLSHFSSREDLIHRCETLILKHLYPSSMVAPPQEAYQRVMEE